MNKNSVSSLKQFSRKIQSNEFSSLKPVGGKVTTSS